MTKNILLTLMLIFTIYSLFSQVKVDTLLEGKISHLSLIPSIDSKYKHSWAASLDLIDTLHGTLHDTPYPFMICRVCKSDYKRIPIVIYIDNSAYETAATLELKVVKFLSGGVQPLLLIDDIVEDWVDNDVDTNANTIKLLFDIGDKEIDKYIYGDTKFALSFFDSNGNILFASNETRSKLPLFLDSQRIKTPIELLTWSFQKNIPSIIKLRTDRESDLTIDTMVNAYSINLVKNTLHSSLFDNVASVRLDIIPPIAKYDSILNEIETIQKRIKELDKIAVYSREDIDFVKDFLVAPNCLSGCYYVSFVGEYHRLESSYLESSLEMLIDYNFASGHKWTYYWGDADAPGFFNDYVSVYEGEEASQEQIRKKIDLFSPMASLLSNFDIIDSVEKKYRQPNNSTTVPYTCVTENLIPFTKEIPSRTQCRKFIELVYSWTELTQTAMGVLSNASYNGDTTAQLYLGQMIEKNDWVAYSLGYRVERFYGEPLHWYLVAALNGSKQGKKELGRFLNEEHQSIVDEELKMWRKMSDAKLVEQETYDRVKKLLNINTK